MGKVNGANGALRRDEVDFVENGLVEPLLHSRSLSEVGTGSSLCTEPHSRSLAWTGVDQCVVTSVGPCPLGSPSRRKRRFLGKGNGGFRKTRSLWNRLVTNARFLLSLCLVSSTLLLLRFETHPLGLSQDEEVIDVVGVAVKPTCVTQEVVNSLNQFFRPRRIIIITTTERHCDVFTRLAHNVECRVESTIIPGVTPETVSAFLEARYGAQGSSESMGRKLEGWYLQQFMKLGAAQYITGLSEHFLVWDMDMILLKGLSVFHKPKSRWGKQSRQFSKQTIVNIGGCSNRGYEYSYKQLTGKDLEYAHDGTSFVTHWIVVYKPFMLEFLGSLGVGDRNPELIATADLGMGSNSTISPAWVWRILDSIDPNFIQTGFSEYASYISWVKQNYPESQHIVDKRTWRRDPLGGQYTVASTRFFNRDGLCCPTKWVTGMMKLFAYQYTGFELGHTGICHYTGAEHQDGYGIGDR